MVTRLWLCVVCGLAASATVTGPARAQTAGSISGTVYDADFDVPLADATVTIIETGAKATTGPQGNYAFGSIEPGTYTLMFAKSGFVRYLEADVLVSAGQVKEVSASLGGDFTEMEEFIVQDIQIGGGTEAALLELRVESPSLIDSISADLMSQAGAGDAAAALNLIPGATVEDGKFAVIRGLPDRYVSSQMNGVRLPTADAEKRAVELDQFPSDVIESIQVSKTFTPDQQGDASGGAVNVVLNGIPDRSILAFEFGYAMNTNVMGAGKEFLTYRGGGVSLLGIDDGERDQPQGTTFGSNTDAVGTSPGGAPREFSMGATIGGRQELADGWVVGGFGTLFYSRDVTYRDKAVDDAWWVDKFTGRPQPQFRGTLGDDSRTSLFDVTQGTVEVKWGGLGAIGIENEFNHLTLLYMYTRAAEDTAILAQDTRGKHHFYPGHDPDDPLTPGHGNFGSLVGDAPYQRFETLRYQERTTQTIQLAGRHELPIDRIGFEKFFVPLHPELDWTLAQSRATSYEPDKRLFGANWQPARTFAPVLPNFILLGSKWYAEKPGSNINFGNVQRLWQDIVEESNQYFINLKIPFEQWTGDEGYFKTGIFSDSTRREFDQDTYSNFGQSAAGYPSTAATDSAPFDFDFSEAFPGWADASPVTDGSVENLQFDVDYRGEQDIFAYYFMMDLPVNSWFKLIGGVRFETTQLATFTQPEPNAILIDFETGNSLILFPGNEDKANTSFRQDDVLPSIGFVFTPVDSVTFRGSYAETVARQTFRELTPILQQEYLGGDIFVGNAALGMSALKNYDLRLDYKPFEGSLFSISWFKKDITDPIEYIQDAPADGSFTFITPVNFPKGQLEGWEFEVRQQLGQIWQPLEGLAIGANATLIDASVELTQQQKALFASLTRAPRITSRDMLNAPEYLYNVNLTYNVEATGTQLGLFYTVKGDTLVTGPGQSKANFIPGVYQTETGTLNFTLSQKIGQYIKLKFAAKNLLDPAIQEVYRDEYIGRDIVKTSYHKGIDFSVGISAEFTF